MLRRMLRCGECGSLIQPAWTTNHGREYRYYACSKRIKTGYGNCKLPSLPAGEIETVVVDQLRAWGGTVSEEVVGISENVVFSLPRKLSAAQGERLEAAADSSD